MSLRRRVIDYSKNVLGWTSRRKIIVISVDDYGNVRLDSKAARDLMQRAGLKSQSIFDEYDALETSDDLHQLYEALTSVKDVKGRSAVFTPFAVPCNIDFERMREGGNGTFFYELLPQTFSKLKGYDNTWPLWKEGIQQRIMVPQFHGREHLNLKVFEEKLAVRDHEVLTALHNRSYSCISNSGYDTISFSAAFEFWKFDENERFHSIIKDGLLQFEKVFGYRATHFNAPGGREHPVIHETLRSSGVLYIDTPYLKREHQGLGNYNRKLNYLGKKNGQGQLFITRNVVFEPCFGGDTDWVSLTLKQIEVAFQMQKPAIISSHRVNFCGHICEDNRKKGLSSLRALLKKVILKWPDVEFMAANELAETIQKGQAA
jgi:hypothetical protein